jgi:hypothetical protein
LSKRFDTCGLESDSAALLTKYHLVQNPAAVVRNKRVDVRNKGGVDVRNKGGVDVRNKGGVDVRNKGVDVRK